MGEKALRHDFAKDIRQTAIDVADLGAPAQRVFRIPRSHLPDMNERDGRRYSKIVAARLISPRPTPGYFRTPTPQQNPPAGSLLTSSQLLSGSPFEVARLPSTEGVLVPHTGKVARHSRDQSGRCY